MSKDLRTLLLADGAYDRIQLEGCNLDTLDLRRTVFQDSNLRHSVITRVTGVRARFTKADLSGADLRGSDFRDAEFNGAKLDGADLRGCSFSAGTRLDGASVAKAKIDRQALRLLGANRGGLTDGAIASMEIHDDLVKLTTAFGGVWSVLHLLAISVFVFPYVAFAVRKYLEARIVQCVECIPLRDAIWDYVVSGGKNNGLDILTVVIFVLLLVYNVLRASLVFKVQALRLAESVSGFPTTFTLGGYWKFAYYCCQTLVWFNFALVAYHAYGLLDTPVSK